MQAPKYIDTSISQHKSLQHAQEIHEKKLQSIKSRKPSNSISIISKNEKIDFRHLKTHWKSTSNSNF